MKNESNVICRDQMETKGKSLGAEEISDNMTKTSEPKMKQVTFQQPEVNEKEAEKETLKKYGPKKKPRQRIKGLLKQLRSQIEFYFSDSNLSKNRFMKQQMESNPEGEVPLETLLSFNKVKEMTQDMKILTLALKDSNILQLSTDGTKVRRSTPVKGLTESEVDERTIYVDGLRKNTSHEWLKQQFSFCGNVTFVSLPRYKSSNDIKGFAFIEFETPEQAAKAVEELNWDKQGRGDLKEEVESLISVKESTNLLYWKKRAAKEGIDVIELEAKLNEAATEARSGPEAPKKSKKKKKKKKKKHASHPVVKTDGEACSEAVSAKPEDSKNQTGNASEVAGKTLEKKSGGEGTEKSSSRKSKKSKRKKKRAASMNPADIQSHVPGTSAVSHAALQTTTATTTTTSTVSRKRQAQEASSSKRPKYPCLISPDYENAPKSPVQAPAPPNEPYIPPNPAGHDCPPSPNRSPHSPSLEPADAVMVRGVRPMPQEAGAAGGTSPDFDAVYIPPVSSRHVRGDIPTPEFRPVVSRESRQAMAAAVKTEELEVEQSGTQRKQTQGNPEPTTEAASRGKAAALTPSLNPPGAQKSESRKRKLVDDTSDAAPANYSLVEDGAKAKKHRINEESSKPKRSKSKESGDSSKVDSASDTGEGGRKRKRRSTDFGEGQQKRKKAESDGEEGKTTEEEAQVGGKKRRKRKKLEKTGLRLRVFTKKEWMRLKQLYMGLQKKNMQKLKEMLQAASRQRSNDSQDSEAGETTIHKNKRTAPEFVPNAIVKIKSDVGMCHEAIKADIPESIQLCYIDVKAGMDLGYIRCPNEENAANLIEHGIVGCSLSLLQGSAEKAYWDKLISERDARLSNKDRPKKRGKSKLLQRAQNPFYEKFQGKHRKFNDDDEADKVNDDSKLVALKSESD